MIYVRSVVLQANNMTQPQCISLDFSVYECNTFLVTLTVTLFTLDQILPLQLLEWEVNGPLLEAPEGPKMIRTRVQKSRTSHNTKWLCRKVSINAQTVSITKLPVSQLSSWREREMHNNKYHTAFINCSWGEEAVKISRQSDGQFHCPCGHRDHSQYDYHQFVKLLSKSPHPEDAAPDCMDLAEDISGEKESPVATVNTEPVQNHQDNSPYPVCYPDDSLVPHPEMDIDPLPTPELPVNPICAAVGAHSQMLHQTKSSSLTRFFQGRALTSVAHDGGIAISRPEAHDGDVDSASEEDIGSDYSEDNDVDLSAMDVDTESDPVELRAHARSWGIHVDPIFNLTICLDCAVAIP
ncbi:hypothetical protein EV702DRAFT_1045327 [Suillus placidus]|uniref:Uncharacterized protein n=1 Tax=Suillus placidus TaxID=48579 RepID=A0A9P7D2Z9_9AGAM|nr:hypothetical protein EV702DRAFT_1045327 [Suillus placidus]